MSEDSHIQHAVEAALGREPGVVAAHIGVTASHGVVTLTGHVESYPQKLAAEAAATGVRGVKAVADELEVRLADDSIWPDEDIAEAAAERLAWNALVPGDAVTVVVDDGVVTLTGDVEWEYQKRAAEHDLRWLSGVADLVNQITIRPSAQAESIADDITHALHRSWFFDASTISVEVEDGKVVLTGTVKTPHERQRAAETAWAEPGVVDVINEITIA